MNWNDMQATLAEAERTMEICDSIATRLAKLLVGRLRKVNGTSTLRYLKAELAKFDSRSGTWKP